MVNYATNINKASIWLSSEIIIIKKKAMTYAIKNPDHGLEQAQKCGKVKPDEV